MALLGNLWGRLSPDCSEESPAAAEMGDKTESHTF